ncbi:hypothetical protein CCP3SC15_2150009 [Gammaproteobacteria bacterium]
MERQLTADAAALALDAKRTMIAADAQRTAEQAYQEQRAQVVSATAQAETILTARLQSATPAAATAEALARAVELDRNYYEFQASPAKQLFDALLPLIVILAVIVFVAYVLRAIVRTAERRALADYEPEQAEQDTLPEFITNGAKMTRVENAADNCPLDAETIHRIAVRWRETNSLSIRKHARGMTALEPTCSQDEWDDFREWGDLAGITTRDKSGATIPTAEGAEWLGEVAIEQS